MKKQTLLPESKDFALDDKYRQPHGVVLLSGVQALVRALQTRSQLDASNDLHTGGFVSGYRGSPLGGLDKLLWEQQTLLEDAGIHFQPGVNEDLAATAVWGSQQVGLHPGAKVDGVFGMWYGKTPGLDRSCDAIRHANAWGSSANGGVLLVVGDDPAAKSSTLATQSEFALQDMMVPVLYPSDVQDVLDYAVLGWQMSRYSGLWVGLKAIADHMDASATVEVGLDRYAQLQALRPSEEPLLDVHIRIEDTPAAQESRLLDEKLPRAIEFARKAGINRWLTKAERPNEGKARLGIVAAGKAYRDVREAFVGFGMTSTEQIRAAGVEVLKLGMTWPLDPALMTSFADTVDQIWVVEEKRAFVEPQLKELLYGQTQHVPVFGKLNAQGEFCLPSTGVLEVDQIARQLVALLGLSMPNWLAEVDQAQPKLAKIDAPAKQERTPMFCAGCPHNTSTRVPQGSRATAGIGCHYMVQWMDRDTSSVTQMGGEGVTWVGEAPFTDQPHIFSNLGDGTYFHSGILAIRQAIAAKVNITYKILFNDAVAMTGGQPTDGELTVAGLVAQVRAEGVQHIVIVSDEPATHTDLKAPDLKVFHRRDLDQVQQDIREVPGVSVLIYQQMCATELRRKRKRGKVEDNRPRVVINEAVCDGCGDCSVQSNCVAVEPVETTHGVKRKINQTACNKDLSCATGYCPAFIEVTGELRRAEKASLDPKALAGQVPEQPHSNKSADILISGVGGTGIVTLSAMLAVAAKIDGKSVSTLDMIGLAQKGGAVFAHIRIGSGLEDDEGIHSGRIPTGCADVLLGCDLVSAASNESLQLLNQNTVAIINTHVMPTAEFVLSQAHDVQLRRRMSRIRGLVGEMRSLSAEEQVEAYLGETQQANIMLLGYAYQLGQLPLSLAALEQAMRLNGVAVQENLIAFQLGRIAADDPARMPTPTVQPVSLPAELPIPTQLNELLDQRADFLTDYHNEVYAQKFLDFVAKVRQAEHAIRPGSEQLTFAVAQSYAKLLAVKDEFEVARLHLNDTFQQSLDAQFEKRAKVKYLLAPPMLSLLGGNTRKYRFGGWMKLGFKLLAAMKPIRNTWLDPFAFSNERKHANQHIEEYENMIEAVLADLNLQNLSTAVALAKLPQNVRGFGHVKQAQYARAKAQQAALMETFLSPPQRVTIFDPSNQAAA